MTWHVLFSTSVKLDPTEGNKFNSSFVQKCHTKYSDNFYSIMTHRTYKTKSHDERNIFDCSTVNCIQITCGRRGLQYVSEIVQSLFSHRLIFANFGVFRENKSPGNTIN